jgi:peptidoglycan/LPS O-acetylase OafA/YrhL
MTTLSGSSDPHSGKIHPLTSMRFFAALMVVFYHTIRSVFPGTFASGFLSLWIANWNSSVSFFFLLSGYILAVVYLSGQGMFDRKKFWVARFARIYPLFFVTLVLDTPFTVIGRIAKYGLRMSLVLTGGTFMMHMALLQAWLPNFRPIDHPNWSLSAEAFFYAVFPFIAPLLWTLRRKWIVLVSFVLYCAGLVLTILSLRTIGSYASLYIPLLHLSTFMLGILLARWQLNEGKKWEWTPLRLFLIFAASVVAYLGVMQFSQYIGYALINNGLLAPVFAVWIWIFSSSRAWFTRLFSLPWLVILGEASYGLYLIHIPLWDLYSALGFEQIPLLYPLYIAVAIGLSVLSFNFLEKPARKWIIQKFHFVPRESIEIASAAQ